MKKLLIISLILITLISFGCVDTALDLTGNTESINESSVRSRWQYTTPFAIVDWSASGTNLTITILNNTAKALTLENVSFGEVVTLIEESISPDSRKVIVIQNILNCKSGEKYYIASYDIKINYSSDSISDLQQHGVSEIVGTCQ
jgi:hypothetical protein